MDGRDQGWSRPCCRPDPGVAARATSQKVSVCGPGSCRADARKPSSSPRYWRYSGRATRRAPAPAASSARAAACATLAAGSSVRRSGRGRSGGAGCHRRHGSPPGRGATRPPNRPPAQRAALCSRHDHPRAGDRCAATSARGYRRTSSLGSSSPACSSRRAWPTPSSRACLRSPACTPRSCACWPTPSSARRRSSSWGPDLLARSDDRRDHPSAAAAGGDPAEAIALASVLALIVGAIMVLGAVARLDSSRTSSPSRPRSGT